MSPLLRAPDRHGPASRAPNPATKVNNMHCKYPERSIWRRGNARNAWSMVCGRVASLILMLVPGREVESESKTRVQVGTGCSSNYRFP